MLLVILSRGKSNNHGGPFHHSSASSILLPQLPRSAEFSNIGTCLHGVFGRLWIFLTRLAMNWRYSLSLFSQCKVTVLSSKHCIPYVILRPSGAAHTFVEKLTAMWPDMSSKRGIRLFLARQDFAAMRPCVTPNACVTTAWQQHTHHDYLHHQMHEV